MKENNNPCLTCPDICCSLKGECGLRLSKEEFETHFKNHEPKLLVREENKVIIISTKEGHVCPNLDKKGCRIYHDRPIDCRLYPYQVLPLYETAEKVKIMLYLQPNCVADRTLPVPESEARALAEEFGRRVYGNKKIVVKIFDDRLFPKLVNKCELLFVKFCKKLGFDK